MKESKHYRLAVCLYNEALRASGERRRKLMSDSLAELEQAIKEDGEDNTYPDFRNSISQYLK